MQDLSVMMSAAGSCRTTCARSLHQDLLCKISLSGSLHQDLCRTTCRRPPSRLHKRNFTNIPCDGHAPSPQRVALRSQKSQLYQHFARWTHTMSADQKSQLYQHFAQCARTISAEGCTSKSEIATLPAFRAIDTHDLRRRLHLEIKKHNFTCIPRTRHARSPQRVHIRNHASEVLRLPRNHEPRSYEMLHWPRRSIPKLKFQKCNPSQELSPSTSKHRIHGANSLRLPRKMQSFE